MTFTLSRLQRLAGIPINESYLEEGANDRYKQLFQSLLQIPELAGTGIEQQVNDIIADVRQTFKRDDRIVWALRLFRTKLFTKLIADAEQSGRQDLVEKLQKITVKFTNQMVAKNPKADALDFVLGAEGFDKGRMESFQHFLSLPIPEIQNTIFGWQTIQQIFKPFIAAEKEWRSQQGEVLNHEPNHEVVMSFPDGMAWVNLHKSYCSAEGAALGHCGNEPGQGTTDTILSLRKKVAEGKWRPSLTFILDEQGMLGEMKGRGNTKPAAKYHQYIIPLLRSDMVKGIKGGGYKPAANFALDDLNTDVKEELMTEKPNLGNLEDTYKLLGWDAPSTQDRVQQALDKLNLRIEGKNGDEIQLDWWRNAEEFSASIRDATISRIIEAIYEANIRIEENPSEEHKRWVSTLRTRLLKYYKYGFEFFSQGYLNADEDIEAELREIDFVINVQTFVSVMSRVLMDSGDDDEYSIAAQELLEGDDGWVTIDEDWSKSLRNTYELQSNGEDEVVDDYEMWWEDQNGDDLYDSRKPKTANALYESSTLNDTNIDRIKRLAGI